MRRIEAPDRVRESEGAVAVGSEMSGTSVMRTPLCLWVDPESWFVPGLRAAMVAQLRTFHNLGIELSTQHGQGGMRCVAAPIDSIRPIRRPRAVSFRSVAAPSPSESALGDLTAAACGAPTKRASQRS